EDGERGAMRFRSIGPISLDRVPERSEAFLIGVAILDDQGGHAIGMVAPQPIPARRAVIHDIHRVFAGAELSEETIDDVGVMAECVSERVVVRRGALAEAWIVGGDDAIAIRERR